ncbi:hypothetical protein T281_08820 [Rhodomicrobium udaipurense JA643]|nr:hypothetical protein T281_08820 [Rhodomicrobium udaipurense JA643]
MAAPAGGGAARRDKRGHGFMTTARTARQGATGLYADLEYRVSVLRPSGGISRTRGSFAPLPCGQPSDQSARYSSKALPQLILTR